MAASSQPPPSEERRSLLVPEQPRWPLDAGPIMELRQVNKSFSGEALFRGLTLEIPPGQTTVIIGESGSGKSVLLKMLLGLVRPDAGEVRLFGYSMAERSERELLELRKRCSMLFQNYALLDSMTVEQNIAFPLVQNTRLTESDIDTRVRELLELLELPDAGAKLPSELSGGMKKRVSLARALITHPEVVLFDEPTTGLDPVMIEFVDEMIQRARERFRITSVIISHDMASVFKLADRIAMLHEGQIVAQGEPDAIRRVKHERLQAFIQAVGSGRLTSGRDRDSTAASPAGLPPPSPGDRPTASGGTPGTPAAGATDRDQATPEPAVELRGVHRSFGPHHVLKGIDLTIPAGLVTVLIGGSGSGKSVIVKHIMGLLQADEGEVRVFGEELGQLSADGLARVQARIGFLFQGAALFDSMTIGANVAFPLIERRQLGAVELRRRVDEMLERLHIPDIAARFPSEVSAGERKRAGLARALVTNPDLIIYDEPTTGQDPIMIRSVDEMIQATWEQFRITAIVISHDMQSTFRIGHRVAMLHRGNIKAFGPPASLLQSQDPIVREFIYAGNPEAAAGGSQGL